jgi:hypothetical protein
VTLMPVMMDELANVLQHTLILKARVEMPEKQGWLNRTGRTGLTAMGYINQSLVILPKSMCRHPMV